MDVATLLLTLLMKTVFLAMPVGTAWLAFRRLSLSETTNAWIYAGTGLFAAFAAAGLAPWALGLQAVSWPFFLFSALCPPLWMAVVLVCGIGRSPVYDLPDSADDGDPAPFRANARPPLLLTDPEPAPEPTPLFRHRPPKSMITLEKTPKHTPEPVVEQPARSVLSVARDMRGHPTTERRRTRRLLPPPEAMSDLPNLPFLPPGRMA